MRTVYFSPLPWHSFAQRPHKFVDWVHRRTGHLVLWVDPYPTRFPQISDLVHRRKSGAGERVGVAPPWVTVVKPGGLPLEPLPGSGILNAPIWRRCFKAIEEFAYASKVLMVIGKPSVLALDAINKFRPCLSLYDAMDDFPAFYSGLSKSAMSRREVRLAEAVDEIWSSSSELLDRWSKIKPSVKLVFNGLDASLIPEVKPRIHKDENRVFGYVGTMGAWFDWEWVIALATLRPHDEIRLIGPLFSAPAAQLPQNIVLLPACDHKTALRLMLDFDVGLIPFKANLLTASVDPIKYYEYRGVALPVLTTYFGEMRRRGDETGVFVSRSQDDIACLAQQALDAEQSPELAREFIHINSWDQRFDEVGRTLLAKCS